MGCFPVWRLLFAVLRRNPTLGARQNQGRITTLGDLELNYLNLFANLFGPCRAIGSPLTHLEPSLCVASIWDSYNNARAAISKTYVGCGT
jgi:hypothetical protein